MRLLIVVVLVGLASSLRRRNGVAIKSDDHIICPVLAALHKHGHLETDSNGDVEMSQLYHALHVNLGIRHDHAKFQAMGIVKYDLSQKGIEETTNACKPPSMCFFRRKVDEYPEDEEFRRFFNLFEMNGKQALEHGISTGVRGGDTNMPPDAVQCHGQYPCKARFEQFFGWNTKGSWHLEDIKKVVCLARKFGDRGGEFAYAENSAVLPIGTVPGREWQMKGAFSSVLFAFGRRDSNGDLFMTTDDWRAIMLESRYPDNFKMREHGCLLYGCEMSSISRFNMDIPCDVDYEEPMWSRTSCNTWTGETCGMFSGCSDGSTCVGGKCICNRGNNLHTMCFRDGACQEQPDSTTWFGTKPRIYPEVGARGNP